MEERNLLSTVGLGGITAQQVNIFGVPVLTQRTINQVQNGINTSFNRFAHTGNINRLNNDLAVLSTRVPFGAQQLFPVWQSDIAAIDPTVPGSAFAAQQQVQADLLAYVQAGTASGAFVVPGTGGFPGGGFGGGFVGIPDFSTRAHQQMVRLVDQAYLNFFRDGGDFNLLNAQLTQAASLAPAGTGLTNLLPVWQNNFPTIDITNPVTILAARNQAQADLQSFIQAGLAQGAFRRG